MAEVVWTEPALQEMDAIADYIALDNPAAARHLVQEVFDKTERLADYPVSGRIPPELPNSVYREVVVPPCRIFYQFRERPRTFSARMDSEGGASRPLIDC